jgi:excisionase family DNA binding protein
MMNMQAVTITQITPSELEKLIRDTLVDALGKQSREAKDERLTRAEVCSLYKISLPTVHECMKKGLPFEKVGRKTLFRREEVDNYFRNK